MIERCDHTGVNAPIGIWVSFAGVTHTWWGHGEEIISAWLSVGWRNIDAQLKGIIKLDSTDLWFIKVWPIFFSHSFGGQPNHLVKPICHLDLFGRTLSPSLISLDCWWTCCILVWLRFSYVFKSGSTFAAQVNTEDKHARTQVCTHAHTHTAKYVIKARGCWNTCEIGRVFHWSVQKAGSDTSCVIKNAERSDKVFAVPVCVCVHFG